MTDQIDAGTAADLETMMSEDTTAETQLSGDDAAAAAEQPEGQGAEPEPTPKKPSAQERIDEVTRLRREAERERDYWRQEALKAAKPQPEQTQQAPAEDAEPNPEGFTYGETDARYIRALARFEAKQEFRQQTERHAAETQARSVEQSWDERQSTFAKDKPDYFEVLDREWPCTPVMADAIKTSDDGAAVAYHLASNPDEARRIAALSPISQVRELGRIEARLSAPAAPAAPIKTISDAPAPAPQVRGGNGQFKVAADTGDFAAFEKTYGG